MYTVPGVCVQCVLCVTINSVVLVQCVLAMSCGYFGNSTVE